MKVVTAKEMREIDRKTILKIGVPGRVLMERAGAVVAAKVMELFEPRKIIVIACGGNNGGDGLVAAKELFNRKWNVKVLLVTKEDRMSRDCLAQLKVARKLGIPLEFRTTITGKDVHGAVVVDAMLGTGLNKDIAGPIARVIAFLNSSSTPVISVDLPSGISSDSGQVMGVAVKASYTVTFGLPKRGHLLYPGADYTGKLFVEEIGFPREFLTLNDINVEIPDKGMMAQLVPERPRYSHKGDYGHVLVVAGSTGRTGAAIMAAKACLRAGAGLVTMGVPESLMDVFQSRVTEEMTLPLPDRGDGTVSVKAVDAILRFSSEKADAICIGPGIGVSDETRKLMREMVSSSRTPLVIDADGINSLGRDRIGKERTRNILRKALAPLVLTPHPGEMARLISLDGSRSQEADTKGISDLRAQIERDRINIAIAFSKATGACLVLKGVPTVIAGSNGRAFINTTGNPGMATAGAGDILAGMVASFVAQGLDAMNASLLGAYMHGLAGDFAAAQKGMPSLVASDIADSIPDAFRELAKENES